VVLKLMGSGNYRPMIITFGENRNSDELAVMMWRGEHTFNPPTINDVPAWSNRRYFKRGQFDKACELIEDAVLMFTKESR